MNLKTAKKSVKLVGMDKDSHVIKLLRAAKEKSGKTDTQIKKETKMALSYLSRFFKGQQSASLPMLIKIGKSLEVKPEQVAAAYRKDKIIELDNEISETLEKKTSK